MENPLFDGAMQGMQMLEAFRNIGRSDEIYKRQMLRQRALDSISEANAQMQMMQAARPVDASGKVSYDLGNPAQMRGVPGFLPQVGVNRDVDPQRKASLVGFDGQSKGNFELMTPDELHSRTAQFKGQDLVQELMMKLNLAEGQAQARSRGQMNVLDYKDGIEKRNQAAEPQINPNDMTTLPTIPLSKGGTLASLLNALKPQMSQTINRQTGDVSYTGVDRTGKPVTVEDPAWRGKAAPRQRQERAAKDPAKAGSASSSRSQEAAQKQIDKIQGEEDKLWAEKASLVEKLKLGVSKNSKGSAKDNENALRSRIAAIDSQTAAMMKRKEAIVARFDGGKSSRSPSGGGKKMTAEDYLKSINGGK